MATICCCSRSFEIACQGIWTSKLVVVVSLQFLFDFYWKCVPLITKSFPGPWETDIILLVNIGQQFYSGLAICKGSGSFRKSLFFMHFAVRALTLILVR